MIVEVFAKMIIYLTKAIFKVFLIALLFFGFIYYTNIGGSMDMLKEKYQTATGSELKPDEILLNLDESVDTSIENIENVSTLFNENSSN